MLFFVAVLDCFPYSRSSLGIFNLNLEGKKPHKALGFGIAVDIKWRHNRRGGKTHVEGDEGLLLTLLHAQHCSSGKSHLVCCSECSLLLAF